MDDGRPGVAGIRAGWQNEWVTRHSGTPDARPKGDVRPFRPRRSARGLGAVLLSAYLVMAAFPAIAQDASPTPRPAGISESMAEKIAAVVASVPAIRGLEPTIDVPYRVIDRDQLRVELEEILREEYPSGLVTAEDDLLTRLGLLSADDDLEELMLSMLESQVVAFYDPRTGTFTFVGPVDRIGALESVVVAHEYDHALQDHRWDWEATRVMDRSRSDAILAETALAEGDATALMYDWAARELKLQQLLEIAADALTRQDERLLRRIPPILRRQLEFPYLDGFAFVNALRGRGDWAAVDAAWDERPLSTEQILHPELYPAEVPVEVELPDIASALGPDWTTSYTQTLGEMQIGIWVADGRRAPSLLPGLPGPLPRAEAAAGWGGDRLVSLDGPGDAWAVVWQTDWDSEADASEFRQAAVAAMKDLDGSSSVTRADISSGLSFPVLVLVADSRSTLDFIRDALGLG